MRPFLYRSLLEYRGWEFEVMERILGSSSKQGTLLWARKTCSTSISGRTHFAPRGTMFVCVASAAGGSGDGQREQSRRRLPLDSRVVE